MPSARDLKVMLVLSVIFMALGVAVELGGVHADVLLISPLLCLAVPLLAGSYLGEDKLARMAAAVASRRRPRRAVTAAPLPRRAPVRVVRGGLILATSLAVRPPPVPLSV